MADDEGNAAEATREASSEPGGEGRLDTEDDNDEVREDASIAVAILEDGKGKRREAPAASEEQDFGHFSGGNLLGEDVGREGRPAADVS